MRAIRSAIAAIVIAAGFILPLHIVTATPITSAAVAAAKVAPVVSRVQTAQQKRYSAMRFALSKKGGWYLYGGNGPTRYDCSGLVVAAYNHVGVSLPRTTYGMLGSSKLIRIPRSQAKWGNLVFFSSGHVEMVSSAYRYAYGAHHSGTRIGYRHYYGSPTFYKVRGT